MEQFNYIDPPNRPMDPTYRPTMGPTLLKNLIFVDGNEIGKLLVGSTDIAASFWEGALQTFDSYKSYEEKCCSSYYNTGIIHEGKFIPESNNYVISESPAYLKILCIPDESGDSIWRDCTEHFERVKNICMWKSDKKMLTAGDKYITVWDVEDRNGLKKIHDYSNFHTDDVTGIATKKTENNIFASTGIDRRTCLWDTRMETPAMELYLNEFCTITSVSWNPVNSVVLAVGTEAGDLYLLDTTQPKEFINVQHCMKNSIHKINFNENGYLAVCGNSKTLHVYNCKKNEFDLIYRNDVHSNFVRGIAWNKDLLYSCGFDGKLCKHIL